MYAHCVYVRIVLECKRRFSKKKNDRDEFFSIFSKRNRLIESVSGTLTVFNYATPVESFQVRELH